MLHKQINIFFFFILLTLLTLFRMFQNLLLGLPGDRCGGVSLHFFILGNDFCVSCWNVFFLFMARCQFFSWPFLGARIKVFLSHKQICPELASWRTSPSWLILIETVWTYLHSILHRYIFSKYLISSLLKWLNWASSFTGLLLQSQFLYRAAYTEPVPLQGCFYTNMIKLFHSFKSNLDVFFLTLNMNLKYWNGYRYPGIGILSRHKLGQLYLHATIFSWCKTNFEPNLVCNNYWDSFKKKICILHTKYLKAFNEQKAFILLS